MPLQLRPEQLEKLHQVKSILEEDCRQHYTHAELCRQTGINEFLLRHGFKQLFKISLYNYLTQLRIAKAKDLLENTRHPIKKIASHVGFTNSPGFIKMFKKHTRQSPTAWRKSHVSAECNTGIHYTPAAEPE